VIHIDLLPDFFNRIGQQRTFRDRAKSACLKIVESYADLAGERNQAALPMQN
jgi:hypothetical protein